MDLTALSTAVLTRIGNPATDGFFTSAQVTDLINEALQAISTEEDWPWLQTQDTITTVAATSSYTPTAGWVRTKQMYIANGEPLIQLSLAEIDSIFDTGQPLAYAIFQEKVHLRPIPNAVYTVQHQYYKSEPALASGSDTPLMPSIFHYSIVSYAAHLANIRQQRLDRAQVELGEANKWIERMRAYKRRSQLPARVRVRPGSLL